MLTFDVSFDARLMIALIQTGVEGYAKHEPFFEDGPIPGGPPPAPLFVCSSALQTKRNWGNLSVAVSHVGPIKLLFLVLNAQPRSKRLAFNSKHLARRSEPKLNLDPVPIVYSSGIVVVDPLRA